MSAPDLALAARWSWRNYVRNLSQQRELNRRITQQRSPAPSSNGPRPPPLMRSSSVGGASRVPRGRAAVRLRRQRSRRPSAPAAPGSNPQPAAGDAASSSTGVASTSLLDALSMVTEEQMADCTCKCDVHHVRLQQSEDHSVVFSSRFNFAAHRSEMSTLRRQGGLLMDPSCECVLHLPFRQADLSPRSAAKVASRRSAASSASSGAARAPGDPALMRLYQARMKKREKDDEKTGSGDPPASADDMFAANAEHSADQRAKHAQQLEASKAKLSANTLWTMRFVKGSAADDSTGAVDQLELSKPTEQGDSDDVKFLDLTKLTKSATTKGVKARPTPARRIVATSVLTGDLWYHVFRFLNVVDLVACKNTCKLFITPVDHTISTQLFLLFGEPRPPATTTTDTSSSAADPAKRRRRRRKRGSRLPPLSSEQRGRLLLSAHRVHGALPFDDAHVSRPVDVERELTGDEYWEQPHAHWSGQSRMAPSDCIAVLRAQRLDLFLVACARGYVRYLKHVLGLLPSSPTVTPRASAPAANERKQREVKEEADQPTAAASNGSANRAVRTTSAKRLRKWLRGWPHGVDTVTRQGLTALHMACLNGHRETVRILLSSGADACVQAPATGRSAAHMAAQLGLRSMLGLFCEPRRDLGQAWRPVSADLVDYYGRSLLVTASSHGKTSCVRYLLGLGADPLVLSTEQQSPLYGAAAQGHSAVVEALLEVDNVQDELLNQQCSTGKTPLYATAEGGHAECAALLLGARADVGVESHRKKSAVYAAAEKGHSQILQQLLLRARVRDLFRLTVYGTTPMYIAVKQPDMATRKTMLKFLLFRRKSSEWWMEKLPAVALRARAPVFYADLEHYYKEVWGPKFRMPSSKRRSVALTFSAPSKASSASTPQSQGTQEEVDEKDDPEHTGTQAGASQADTQQPVAIVAEPAEEDNTRAPQDNSEDREAVVLPPLSNTMAFGQDARSRQRNGDLSNARSARAGPNDPHADSTRQQQQHPPRPRSERRRSVKRTGILPGSTALRQRQHSATALLRRSTLQTPAKNTGNSTPTVEVIDDVKGDRDEQQEKRSSFRDSAERDEWLKRLSQPRRGRSRATDHKDETKSSRNLSPEEKEKQRKQMQDLVQRLSRPRVRQERPRSPASSGTFRMGPPAGASSSVQHSSYSSPTIKATLSPYLAPVVDSRKIRKAKGPAMRKERSESFLLRGGLSNARNGNQRPGHHSTASMSVGRLRRTQTRERVDSAHNVARPRGASQDNDISFEVLGSGFRRR